MSLSLILALGAATTSALAAEYRYHIPEIGDEVIVGLGILHSVTNLPGLPPVHGHVTVLKSMDKSTPMLAQRLCSGQFLKSVFIATRSETEQAISHFSIRLKDVLVSSFQTSGGHGGDPVPTESVSFSYAKIEWTYIQTDLEGAADHAGSTYWDENFNIGGYTDPDSDEDGIPDSYEALHRLKPLLDDADEDLDGDGLTNREEYRAGTSASDFNSVLKVSGVSTPTSIGFTVKVEFDSVPNRTYDLFAMSEVDGSRTLVETITASADVTTVELNLAGTEAFVLVAVQVD